jgi:hypothetical protein
MTLPPPLISTQLVDKNGCATPAFQRFLLSLYDGDGKIDILLNGTTATVSELEFGSGFSGKVGNGAASLSAGLSISGSDGVGLTDVSTLVLEGDFNLKGSGTSATITGAGGAGIEIESKGVVIDPSAGLINFLGSPTVTSITDGVAVYVPPLNVFGEGRNRHQRRR